MDVNRLIKKFSDRNSAKQFWGFCLVGVSNIAIALVVYYFMILLGFDYLIANVLAWIISVANAYYWNHKYVFRIDTCWWRELWKSYVSYGVSFLVGMIILYIMVDCYLISVWLAPVLVLCLTTPINYLLNKFWIFRRS